MLTIGLDLRPIDIHFKAHYGRGTGRYTDELSRHLHKSLDDTLMGDSVELVSLFAKDLSAQGFEKKLVAGLPFGRQTIETQLLLPRRLGNFRLDLMHFFSHGDAPARCPLPYVLTVLDLIPLRFPDLYRAARPNWRFQLARRLEHQAIGKARGILAISESTKTDLMELLGVEEERIVVTPLAVNDRFRPRNADWDQWEGEIKRTKQEFGLPGERPLLLYVGGIDPRKNISFLLNVFAGILEHCPKSGRPVLAMAGQYGEDDQYPRLLDTIRELGLAEEVRLLGFVAEQRLVDLYRAANITVFPSLYEGFGFPVLESMACGVPVVAGNNSSIPEVAGPNGALLLRDNDKNSWVREIIALLESPQRQIALGLMGIQQSRKFSWARTAETTLRAYLEFAGNTWTMPRRHAA